MAWRKQPDEVAVRNCAQARALTQALRIAPRPLQADVSGDLCHLARNRSGIVALRTQQERGHDALPTISLQGHSISVSAPYKSPAAANFCIAKRRQGTTRSPIPMRR